ncbi:hypothetical protein BDQ17DRAFT_1372518 [Cyathus striatus]|nr:hypothetical protein BDQ17DRAFT_1372518 [Cyathus striatus]
MDLFSLLAPTTLRNLPPVSALLLSLVTISGDLSSLKSDVLVDLMIDGFGRSVVGGSQCTRHVKPQAGLSSIIESKSRNACYFNLIKHHVKRHVYIFSSEARKS